MKRVVFFTKSDQKSGYRHLDIFPEHQPFLGFSWVTRLTRTQNSSCLPFSLFGLSSAPYIFTKLFRPLVKHSRSKGRHSVDYLDDGLDVQRSEALSSTNSNIIKSDLALAGFLANMDKCLWDPVQVVMWLGIVWDGVQGVVSITEPRLKKCLAHIDMVLSELTFRLEA